jgi:hypothetical protein
VALEVDDVAVVVVALAFEEMIEADFVEGGCGCVGGDVAADAVFELVRLDDHRQRIPANQTLDAPFDLATAWERRLLRRGDGVDVGRVRGEWLGDAAATRVIAELAKQAPDSCGASRLQHVVERLEPFARLERLDLGSILRCGIAHESSMGPAGH